jgi:hypothetical protein
MPDPITGPIELGFFVFSLVVALWIAIYPRKVLEFLFSPANPLSASVISSLRILAGACAAGVATILVIHILNRWGHV